MTTALAWIGAQAFDAFPTWGWLYVWTIFCDVMVLAFLSRLTQPRFRRAANDPR